MPRRLARGLGLAFLLIVLGMLPVSADQVYVCTGCTAPPGFDPNPIDPNSINVGFAGAHTAVSPLLIIVGVPNGDPAPGNISLPSGVNAAAAGTYYGLNVATSGSLAAVLEGTMSSSGCSNAYACSGIANSGGGSSESFGNWTTSPFPGGALNPDTSVTSFNLYAYAIDYALNSNSKAGAVNSPINIDLAGTHTGEFVIAYNCAVAGATCTGGNIGSTPFTNSGFIPEPRFTALLLVGLLVAGGWIRQQYRTARSQS